MISILYLARHLQCALIFGCVSCHGSHLDEISPREEGDTGKDKQGELPAMDEGHNDSDAKRTDSVRG